MSIGIFVIGGILLISALIVFVHAHAEVSSD